MFCFILRIFLGQSQVKEKFDRARAWFDQDYHVQERYTVCRLYLVKSQIAFLCFSCSLASLIPYYC